MLARVFTTILAFATGAAIGFVLTFTHRQYVVDLGGTPVPLGLIAALVIVAALLAGMRLAFEDRLAALAAGVGVVVASAVLAISAGGGSVLVLDDALGYMWALGPAVIAIVVVGWPRRRQPRTPEPLRRTP